MIGFYGTLQDWVDLELIAEVARRRPDWSIVLIGRVLIDTGAAGALPNVHLLGARPYEELPAYCKGFDVGLIPYRISEQLPFGNPLKLREYLSAGLPVVSTAVPEVRRYDRWCAVAADADGFVRRSEAALAADSPERRRERSRAMEGETWEARVADVARWSTRRRAPTGTQSQRTLRRQRLMSAAPFRAGMVGAGNICEFHVAAVQALPDVELVGVTDLDRARARRRRGKWGTTAFASLDALVEAGANVIHVLTPPSAHAAVALAALERGCHVLIEKPIAEDVEDARRIGELARRRGLVASVNHSLLYDPQVVRALEQVRAGALGDVVGVDILRGSEYPPYEGGPLPPHYRDAGYPCRDLGVHCLYLIQELLGPIEDVDAEWRASAAIRTSRSTSGARSCAASAASASSSSRGTRSRCRAR